MIKIRMKPGKTLREVVDLGEKEGQNLFSLSTAISICRWYRYTPEGNKRRRSGRFGATLKEDGEIIMNCIPSTKKASDRDCNEIFQRSLYLGYLLGKLDAITIEEDAE